MKQAKWSESSLCKNGYRLVRVTELPHLQPLEFKKQKSLFIDWFYANHNKTVFPHLNITFKHVGLCNLLHEYHTNEIVLEMDLLSYTG